MDHTADLGINVFGTDAETLFRHAALALRDQIVEPADLKARHECRVVVAGDGWPDLMVNWLREILYLWAGKACLLHSVHIESITENHLISRCRVDPFSLKRHRLKSEIKAVTYHQIQVHDTGHGWEARVIFDI